MSVINPSPPSSAGRTWTVGTLTYTRFGLFSVFFWMLWGDLCVNIMETIIPRIVPLQLARVGAMAATIGLVTSSVPAGVELIINPFVSTFSDRFRSRLGRRRPFILVCTPILALCLVAVGMTDLVVPKIHAALGDIGMSAETMTIVLLGVLLAVFQFFNVVVLATYYYMIADVVPQEVIGKFTAWYKVCGAMGGVIFNKFIFQYADTHQWQIYLGCGLIYLVAFLLMGWRVKEGEYPPPAKLSSDGSALSGAAQWLRESFSIRFYQKFYLIGLFYWAAFGAFIFQQMYALNDLGISKAAAGDAFAWAGLITLPLFFVLGPLSDRFHPVRMVTIGMFIFGVCSLACFFFIQRESMRPMWDWAWAGAQRHPWLGWCWQKVLGTTPAAGEPIDLKTFYGYQFLLWTTVWTVGQTAYYGAQISLMPRVLPRAQYGQYCAANNTLCALAKFGAPWLCGWLIVKLGNNYRFNYLWSAACCVAGTIACIAVYLHWKRLGGDEHYTPPMLAGAAALPPVTVAPVADPGDMAVPGAVAVEATNPEVVEASATSAESATPRR
jgi:MFS family permease